MRLLALLSLLATLLSAALCIRSTSHWDKLYTTPAPGRYLIAETAGGSLLVMWGWDKSPTTKRSMTFYSDPYVFVRANWSWAANWNEVQFPLVLPTAAGLILPVTWWGWRRRKRRRRGFQPIVDSGPSG
ncbi:MAG TPA: hypothetical protein VFE58_09425 [Tepidisphaeraceae bacterium]|nr:hypothetical protein [Tepidisphaeraceae bacterium]